MIFSVFSRDSGVPRVVRLASWQVVLTLLLCLVPVIPSHAFTSFYIDKKSSVSATKCTQSLTTSNSTAVTSGGACFSDTATDQGKGIWSNEDGFVGTIESVSSATTATLFSNSPVQSAPATAFWIGAIAGPSQYLESGVNDNAISALTVKSSASGLLNLRGNGVENATINTTARILINGTQISQTSVSAKVTDFGLIVPFTAPAKGGTYLATVQTSLSGTYSGAGNDTSTQIFTLTVLETVVKFSPNSSIVRIAPPDTTASTQGSTTPGSFTSALDTMMHGAAISASGPNRIATIQVILLNDDGSPALQGNTVSASVSDGLIIAASNTGVFASGGQGISTITLTEGIENIAWFHISTNLYRGTSTIDIYVTDAISGERTLVAKKQLYSHGDLTKLEVVTSNFSIGLAGYTTGAATSTRSPTAEVFSPTAVSSVSIQGNGGQTTTPAFIIKATDSLGQLMNLDTSPEVVSSDLKVATGGACSQDDGTTSYSSGKGYGYYNCFFSIATGAKSGDKATLTIRSLDPARASGTTSYISTTYEISVGGFATLGKTILTFDKEKYLPGEAMTVTLTATDSSGNLVFDGHPSPAVIFNKAVPFTFPTGFFINGKITSDSSNGEKNFYAPEFSGDFTGTALAASGQSLKVTATVVSTSTEASQAVANAGKSSAAAAGKAQIALKKAQDAAAKATAAATKARISADKTSDAVDKLTNQINTNLSALQVEIAKLVKKISTISSKI